jgi:hypothetical protein
VHGEFRAINDLDLVADLAGSQRLLAERGLMAGE